MGAGAKSDIVADLITFNRAKGVYGGLNFDGTVVTAADDWNQAYYGKKGASSRHPRARYRQQQGRRQALVGGDRGHWPSNVEYREAAQLVSIVTSGAVRRAGRNIVVAPPMMSAQPAIIGSVIGSSRNSAPHNIPNAGIRNAIVSARVGPISAISR